MIRLVLCLILPFAPFWKLFHWLKANTSADGASCATGLVLGYKAGPWGMGQGCLGIGIMSYYLEKLGFTGSSSEAYASPSSARTALPIHSEELPVWAQETAHLLLRPAAAIFLPCSGGACEVSPFQQGRPAVPRPHLPRRLTRRVHGQRIGDGRKAEAPKNSIP